MLEIVLVLVLVLGIVLVLLLVALPSSREDSSRHVACLQGVVNRTEQCWLASSASPLLIQVSEVVARTRVTMWMAYH